MDNKASRFGNPAFRMFYDKVDDVGVLSESSHVALVIRAFWRYIQVMWTGSSLLAPMAYGASTATTSCPSCSDLLNYEGTSISVQKRSMVTRSSTNWQTTICTLLVSMTILALTGFSDKNSFSPVAPAYGRRHFSCTWFLRTPYALPSTAALLFLKVKDMGQGQPAMIKRYKAQVPGRLFVMQHFLFGSILPCKGPPPPSET
ncbi:hypothetical protein PISMIDRAFT_689711, partial [Pisolithus microcarpus 441]